MSLKDVEPPTAVLSSSRSECPSFSHFVAFQQKYTKWLESSREQRTVVSDMVFGNPNDPPSEPLLKAMRSNLLHSNALLSPTAFAYDVSFDEQRQIISKELRQRRGLPFNPEHISLCNAALGGLLVTLQALTDVGDEVLCMEPSYFFYGALLDLCGCKRVLVPTKPDFDLDIAAIRLAITPRTRVIIINSPNNPSGRIYPPDTLRCLSEMLAKADTPRPIVLLSDEAYCRIVFDDVKFHSPTQFYPYSLLVYTYGKTTLAPGERLGYIALSPLMPSPAREQLSRAIFTVQVASYSFPNRTTASTIRELNGFCIDIDVLQRRRDYLMNTLVEQGWLLHKPAGAFYMLVKVPKGIADDEALVDILAEHNVLTMPGSMSNIPGWIRLSLTASDEMIKLAIPVFQKVMNRALNRSD